jgi:DNA-binding transcriptional MerR regulator
MFKIRDFSRFTRVTMKMLRHYDELGLLKPVTIDPESGYRYYSSDQLPRLNRIIALKDLGFSLEQVGRLLDENLSGEEIRGMFRMRQAEIEENLRLEQARLSQVDTRLRYLEQNPQHLNFDVVVRDVAPVMVASIRLNVSNEEQQVFRLFEELEIYVAAHQARAYSSPFVIYHDEEFKEDGADIEVAVPIQEWIQGNDRITVREVLGMPGMACLVYTGGYDRTDEALNALMIWIEANGYRSCGPLREVFLRFNADGAQGFYLPKAFLTDRKELFVSEIQLPVEKVQGPKPRR